MIHFLASSNFYLLINGNSLFLIGLIFASFVFSIIIYRYTIPSISKKYKIFLTILRSSIFVLICLLLFESTINLTSDIDKEKYTYLYIDNSNSVANNDSVNTSKKIISFVEYLTDSKKENLKFFSFGNNVNEIKKISSLKFDEQGTNFYSVYNHINKNKNEISNVIIVSDGILNQGEDPINSFGKTEVPIYTIGVGDTSSRNNILINNIEHSQFIYFNKETNISVIILNQGFDNQDLTVRLYEEDKLISQKNELLNNSGFNKVTFKIKPNKIGEVKYKIEIDKLNGESSFSDNSKVFYLKVMSNKIKIGLVSDAPNNDLSAIINALRKDDNFQLIKFYKINNSKIWNEPNIYSIDSVDVFFFINFPIKSTNQTEIEKFLNQIKKGKPIFISVSNQTDLEKLNYFSNSLPITIKSSSYDIQKVQPELMHNEFISQFSQVGSKTEFWNKLAPIDQINFNFSLKAESKIIVNSQINRLEKNIPIIVIRSIGNERSFLFNGFNFWYWQLQNAETNNETFSEFIIEIAKWLTQIKNKKYFSIKTNKNSYSQNEQVEFTAELYDHSFNPVDTSSVKIKIKKTETEINLTSEGNGIYTAKYVPNEAGEITFEATNTFYKNENSKTNGKFFVSSVPIEKIDNKSNTNYLKQISNQTNGKYFYINHVKIIINHIVSLKSTNNKVLVKEEIQLWNNKYILLTLILILTLEWFTRKKLGMI